MEDVGDFLVELGVGVGDQFVLEVLGKFVSHLVLELHVSVFLLFMHKVHMTNNLIPNLVRYLQIIHI